MRPVTGMWCALALATALALFAPPEAAVLGAAFTLGAAIVGSTLLGSTFLAAAAATAINIAASIALSYAINAAVAMISGKPKRGGAVDQGVRTQMQTGGAVPRSFILGRAATAGSLIWANTWGESGNTPNAYLTMVIALADLPVHSLRKLFVNGEPVTLGSTMAVDPVNGEDMGFPVNAFTLNFDDGNAENDIQHMWVRLLDGTQTTAPAFLTDTAATADRPYQSTRVGYGVAYAIVTTLFNRDLLQGIPRLLFEVQGGPLYDITKDTTAGGSGSQRFDDPSTWERIGNDIPAIQIYNLLRGVRVTAGDLTDDWLYGPQDFSAAQLPSLDWRLAVSKSRTEGFLTGGEITVDTPCIDVIEGLLAGCQGRVADDAGVAFRLHQGNPGSSVASFSDADIISTQPQSFTPFFGLAETVNGVTATYPAAAEVWQPRAAPPLYDADLEAEDGGRRLPAALTFDYVYDDELVQRHMRATLLEALRARRHTHVLPESFEDLRPGDRVSWTSARNGYITKDFRIDGMLLRGDLDVMIDITEMNPDDYDWTSESDYVPVSVGFLSSARPAAQATSVTVEPASVKDALGANRRPAIRLLWTSPNDVTAIAWQVRVKAGAVLVGEGRVDDIIAGASSSTIISAGILNATTYEVRARFIAGSARVTMWSAWLEVTTADYRLTGDDLDEAITTSISNALTLATETEEDVAALLLSDNAQNLTIAQLESRGVNLIRKGSFEDGERGGWFAACDVVNSFHAGWTKGLRSTVTSNTTIFENELRRENIKGRKYRFFVGKANANGSGRRIRVGINYEKPDGTFSSSVVQVVAAGGTFITNGFYDFTITEDTVAWRPSIICDLGNTPSAANCIFHDLRLVDVTEAEDVRAYYKQSVGILAADGVAAAQAITTQQSSLNDAIADIEAIATTYVDESDVVSIFNNTVSIASGGDFATASDLTIAFKTVKDGLGAQRILGVDVNGVVGQVSIGASPAGSFIDFLADRIRFRNVVGGTPVTALKIEGGEVWINDSRVLNGDISSVQWSADAGNGASAPVGSLTTLRSLVVDRSSPNPVLLQYSASVENGLAVPSEVELRVTEDGGLTALSTVIETLEPGQKRVLSGFALDVARATAGNVTFRLAILTPNSAQFVGRRVLIAELLKK